MVKEWHPVQHRRQDDGTAALLHSSEQRELGVDVKLQQPGSALPAHQECVSWGGTSLAGMAQGKANSSKLDIPAY